MTLHLTLGMVIFYGAVAFAFFSGRVSGWVAVLLILGHLVA